MPSIPTVFRCRIERLPEGLRYRFPEIPEADFTAPGVREGRLAAPERLAAALAERIREGRIPQAAAPHAGEGAVRVPPSFAAKALFLEKSAEAGMYPAELARRLGMKPQEVHRIYRPDHATKIDQISEALLAIGWRLTLGVEPAGGREAPAAAVAPDAKKAAPRSE